MKPSAPGDGTITWRWYNQQIKPSPGDDKTYRDITITWRCHKHLINLIFKTF
jgi:hypothetical protein